MDAPLDWEEILEILRIAQDTSCEEIYLEIGDFKLIIKKTISDDDSESVSIDGAFESDTIDATKLPESLSSEGDSVAASVSTTGVAGRQTEDTSADADTDDDSVSSSLVRVKSPMIGTFYRAHSPGAPPFVEVGDSVGEGDPVGIIDVMKLMNTIKSPSSGLVREILVENAALVEYGETLMLLDPS